MNWLKKIFTGEPPKRESHSLTYADIRRIWTAAGFQTVPIYRSGRESWMTTSWEDVIAIGGTVERKGDDCAGVQTEWLSRFRGHGLAVGGCLGVVAARFQGGHFFGWFIDHDERLVCLDPEERFSIGRDVIKTMNYARIN